MKSYGWMVLVAVAATSTRCFGDFTYQETTQVTGGSMLAMMKVAGTFSKSARQVGEPMVSTVMVKGNRMTRIGQYQTEIVDLDRGTITQIDVAKKQYTVMTFDQMKQRLDAAAAKAKEEQASQQQGQQPGSDKAQDVDVTYSVQVRSTGATKDLAGTSANESILTMMANGTNKTTGQQGSLAITNDMWLASEIAGYVEVREFYKRYAEKMGRVFSGSNYTSMLASQPGASQGMAELVQEMSKLKGIPVLQVMRMGMTTNGQPLAAASEAPLVAQGPMMPSAGEVAQQSAASAIASKLGGFGGLGGFGRKKKPEAAASAASGDTSTAVLMETKTEMSGFSQQAVDTGRFEVPAGYRQVVMPDGLEGRE